MLSNKKVTKYMLARPIVSIHEKFIKRQKEGIPFVIFAFFLLTFVFSRFWVYLSIKGLVPESLTENVHGVHIHHFAWGVLLICLVGFLALTLPQEYLNFLKVKLAAAFGIGLGLTFDEFGMWLRLEDEYWLRQSYDAIIVVSIILINIIYFPKLWKRIGRIILRCKPKGSFF